MNELIHNFLTDMPLPYFLAMYGACSLIAILAGSFWIWLCDGTRDEDLTDELALLQNPYEIEKSMVRVGGPERACRPKVPCV